LLKLRLVEIAASNSSPSEQRPLRTAAPQNSSPSEQQPLRTAAPQNSSPSEQQPFRTEAFKTEAFKTASETENCGIQEAEEARQVAYLGSSHS
jgi:hypothetical protein